MRCICRYETPEGLDDLIMISDGKALTGLVFDRPGKEKRTEGAAEESLPVFERTAEWLDAYFAGNPESDLPEIRLEGAGPFRKRVLEMVAEIPYGGTAAYGEIAAKLAEERGIPKMSPRAVGSAVGWNPVCILIPCHRVIGADGSLTGYAGGIENKKRLLAHEQQR